MLFLFQKKGPKGDRNMECCLKTVEKCVLKPQREGGGKQIFPSWKGSFVSFLIVDGWRFCSFERIAENSVNKPQEFLFLHTRSTFFIPC